MPVDNRRQIIEAVARGELTPAEAAARLDEAGAARPAPSPEVPPAEAVESVAVDAELGMVRIEGDPTVAGAVAEGAHSAHREGGALRIRATPRGPISGFVFGRRGHFDERAGKVRIRMNPDLALRVEVSAGEVRVHGVHAPITADVAAGSLRLEDVRAPLQLRVRTGEVRAQGQLRDGASSIRCDAGSVRIGLDPGSSVRVRIRSALGQVDFDGESAVTVGNGTREMVVGQGAGTLDIDTTLGHVRVETAR